MEVAGATRTDSRPRKNVKRCAVPVSGPSLGVHLSLVWEEVWVSNLTIGKYLNYNDCGKTEQS